MIDDLRELNEQFYALYGRLYKNRELLGKAQEDSMAAKLLAQYEAEYELLHLREEIGRMRELYELRLKRSALIPRTWRSWLFRRKYNRAAVLSGERIAAEVERYFAEREAALYAQHQEEAADGEAAEQAGAPEEASGNAPETAQETSARGNAGEPEETDREPKETAERAEDAEQGTGEADLSEKPVGAGAATDGSGGERFTAAPTADGDDAPTGNAGLRNGSTASI